MIAKVLTRRLSIQPLRNHVASVRQCGKATQPDNHQPYMRCVIQRSARTKPNARPSNDSIQSSSAPTSLMHRVDFDVVLRKLISEEQAVS